ncbi:cutinase family protein [Candidatus Bathyarchaeota archaeon]|nr:cutinase family protein [Candidatus Bathyarchaeota archaeon]
MGFVRQLPRPAILAVILAFHFISLVHGLPPIGVASAERVAGPAGTADVPALGPQHEIPDALAKFPKGPLNELLAMFSSLPEGEAALDATAKLLTPLQQSLADATDIDTTRQDLAENAPCSDYTIIFARGTTEPGNVGLVTGPPFFDALSEELGAGSLAVQGVEYPATFAGFNRNGTDGVPSM